MLQRSTNNTYKGQAGRRAQGGQGVGWLEDRGQVDGSIRLGAGRWEEDRESVGSTQIEYRDRIGQGASDTTSTSN